MVDGTGFDEDLPALAAEAYGLSAHLCGACRDFHALWPYRRLTRMVGAVESGGAELAVALADLFAAGQRRVLIAGAADTGVLALAARAGARHPIDVTAADACATPLELCRRFAASRSLPLETVQLDLTTITAEREYDVVIAHSLLQFIAPDRRLDLVVRLARSLRRGGRLVVVFNTGQPLAADALPGYRRDYASWIVEALGRMNIPLPAPEAEFRARFASFQSREGSHAGAEEVDDLLRSGGFSNIRRTEIGNPLAAPFGSLVSTLSKRRFLTIAEPG